MHAGQSQCQQGRAQTVDAQSPSGGAQAIYLFVGGAQVGQAVPCAFHLAGAKGFEGLLGFGVGGAPQVQPKRHAVAQTF